jgi:hypothetical protein
VEELHFSFNLIRDDTAGNEANRSLNVSIVLSGDLNADILQWN